MEKVQENFNTITNILILLVLFFGSLSYADSNGVWQYASDTRGGTFGSDETGFNSNYTFVNPVYFYTNTIATGLSTFNDLNSNTFNTNSLIVNGNLNVSGIVKTNNIQPFTSGSNIVITLN